MVFAQPWLVILTVWFCVMYFRLVFYLGSVDLQLRAMLAVPEAEGADAVEPWLETLGWIAPLGALFAPAMGWIQDRRGSAAAFFVVQVLGILHQILLMIPVVQLQPISFLLYTCQQEALFAVVLSSLLHGLGPERFGVAAGVLFLFGAAAAAIVSPATAAALLDPSGLGFLNANIGLLVLMLAVTGLLVLQNQRTHLQVSLSQISLF